MGDSPSLLIRRAEGPVLRVSLPYRECDPEGIKRY